MGVINITNNATNGDVIKALFPNANDWEVTKFGDANGHYVDFGTSVINCFEIEWWNTPYKGDGE